ncbi:MAG: Mur ligase domain-containing protein [Victivallales bacterium]|jgi:UDP-N-acetylmuramate--alanine ligase|nr:Mur ligase domain-containing protein [Victivallales bacterium]
MSEQFQNLFFVGIGGAGMAPLAEIMLVRGAKVSGSDQKLNAKTTLLAAHGATIYAGHDASYLPRDTQLLIYSSAVVPENPERQRAAELGIEQIKRGELLARLARCYRRAVAISGSHGKSSVSAMIAHILVHTGQNPGFLIGGAVKDAPSAAVGENDDLFVMEVDESDGTHALITPYLGVVPNVEDDHSWSVGGEAQLFENFKKFAFQSERLIYYAGTHSDELFADHPDAVRLEYPPHGFFGDKWYGFQAWNAYLAIKAAELLGIDSVSAEHALESFAGVERRMSLRYNSEKLVIVEDYAHHPTELASSIGTLRLSYPTHHLRVVFQPHRYARLQKYLTGFGGELAKADSAIVTPVFAAWCEKGAIDGGDLAFASGEHVRYLDATWERIAKAALDYRGERPLLLAIIGAGDIDQIFNYL